MSYSSPSPERPLLPEEQSPVPPKKSKAGKILLIVLAVVLVICGGAGGVAYFALRDTVDDVVQATRTRLVTPEKLSGRPKITDPELQSIADEITTGMKQEVPEANSTVAAFYGDPEKQDMIMVAGASGLIADPAKELDSSLTGLAETGLKMTGIESVEAGPLGGQAKCGTANAEGVPVVFCIWTDNGSVGLVGFYFKKQVKDVKADFVTIRGEVEQHS